MRHTPGYITTDPDEIKRLIRDNPWATFVSTTANGMVASHYPVMLEEDADGISIVSHFGRPDEQLHELGAREILVIIQGPHGYISPSWYDNGEIVPTWNHVTAHLYGTPEVLSEEENYRVLDSLVDYFEERMPHPVSLDMDEAGARRIAKGTVGLRLAVTRFDARLKLNQNKTQHSVDRVIDELQAGENYSNPDLAREMRRIHGDAPS
jgi:transcriptional regulator